MDRIDLSDTAIVISVKVDSKDRLANLDRVRSYYDHFCDGAEFRVVEQGDAALLTHDPASDFHCHFLRDAGMHWKTRNMNLGAKQSRRDILLMSDCDTVPHPEALAEGLAIIRDSGDFVHLFDGVVVNISKRLTSEGVDWSGLLNRISHFAPSSIDPRQSADNPDVIPLYGNADYRAVGGAFLCRRESFFDVGGWNENFISYGYEDQEFDARVRALGKPFSRTEGFNLYHFDHVRGIDSRYTEIGLRNREELARVLAMSAEDLLAYAQRGFRTITFVKGFDYTRTPTTDADGWQRTKDTRTDLSELTILVAADPKTVRYSPSCLKELLEYLEANFCNYDLRLCENRHSYFKNIHSKTNVSYRTYPDGLQRQDLEDALREAGRQLVYPLRLSQNAEAQLAEVTALFDQVLGGQPAGAVFQASDGLSIDV